MRNKEWKKYKLSNITSKLGDGLHGTPKYDNNGEYYFINGNNLENGKIVIKPDTKRVSFTEYQKYKKELNNNTILLSINGTLGNIGYYNNEKVILGKSACYFNLKDGFSKDYVRYIMSTKSFKLFLENFATGATIKNVSLDAMRNFEFYAPRKDLQDKIAKILSNYDNLIENNNKRIKILEEMAQKIYKEWFVDFKFPKHETTTFKASSLGKIPRDWKILQLDNIANITMGQSPKSKFYNENNEGLPFHQGVTNFGIRYPFNKTYCSCNGRVANINDILLSVRAPVGRINITKNTMLIGRGLAALNSKNDNQTFLFYLLSKLFEKEDQFGNGAVFNAITKEELSSLEVMYPSNKLITSFETIVKPIDILLMNLLYENENLKQTRDILLPRLISGEIDVENMEVI